MPIPADPGVATGVLAAVLELSRCRALSDDLRRKDDRDCAYVNREVFALTVAEEEDEEFEAKSAFRKGRAERESGLNTGPDGRHGGGVCCDRAPSGSVVGAERYADVVTAVVVVVVEGSFGESVSVASGEANSRGRLSLARTDTDWNLERECIRLSAGDGVGDAVVDGALECVDDEAVEDINAWVGWKLKEEGEVVALLVVAMVEAPADE